MNRICILAVIAVAAAAGEAEARWAVVAKGPLRETIQATASVKPMRSAMLAARIGGRVTEVLVDVGDRVAAGQELLRLDPAVYQLQLDLRGAELEAARARVQAASSAVPAATAEVIAAVAEAVTAQRERERREALRERGEAVSEQELERAGTAAAVAASRVAIDRALASQAVAKLAELRAATAAAESAVGLARQDLAEATVRAPFAGVISRRLVDPGAVVTTMPLVDLLEVQAVDQLWLEYALPQEAGAAVVAGAPIHWRIDGAGEGDATVTTVWPVLDQATRSLRLRTRLDAGARLRPGQLATVVVVLRSEPEAVVVPRPALRRSGDAWVATCRDGERRVRIGISDGERAQVLDGLKPGDEVRLP